MNFEPTPWGELRVGAVIVCPRDQQPERVTFTQPAARGRRMVRTEGVNAPTGHSHTRPGTDKVHAHNDNGHRDVTWRTRYGTAVATRPGPRAPWWLHLPAGWPRHDKAQLPTSRQNSLGAFFFRSRAGVAAWLAPYIVPEARGEAPPKQARRRPGIPPVRAGGYT